MELRQNITFALNEGDRPFVTAHEQTQQVSFHLWGVPHGFCITLSTAHIDQVEQLLTALWAMKDEQEGKQPDLVVKRPSASEVEQSRAA